ncbi:MAG TPA: ribosome assembly cofactor RimP [Bacteroidales bacterium]|nr:ribosome assembly cofactor RimP [Bacteroidales bacterium]
MTDKDKIEELIKEYISGTGMFVVSVKVSAANRITVLADTREGITINECVLLHRHIENGLDRDAEDFELQVSSPGLDSPFTVIEQYQKNEGKKVSVVDNEGTKYSGILKNVTSGGFDLETEVKIKGKGKEKKDIPFNFDQVKATKIVLTIT